MSYLFYPPFSTKKLKQNTLATSSFSSPQYFRMQSIVSYTRGYRPVQSDDEELTTSETQDLLAFASSSLLQGDNHYCIDKTPAGTSTAIVPRDTSDDSDSEADEDTTLFFLQSIKEHVPSGGNPSRIAPVQDLLTCRSKKDITELNSKGSQYIDDRDDYDDPYDSDEDEEELGDLRSEVNSQIRSQIHSQIRSQIHSQIRSHISVGC